METKQEIIVDNLITLCHIIDDYEKVSHDLNELMPENYNYKIVNDLYKLANKKITLTSKKIKKFYNENKKTIQTIIKYTTINSFLECSYDLWAEKKKETSSLDYYYLYLLKHKKEMPKILILLNKIKELKVKFLVLDENANFKNETYVVNADYNSNIYIYYLENMIYIPNYSYDMIEYTTTDSNYVIKGEANYGRLSSFSEITVNNLIFNKNRLPDNNTKEIIFDKIVKLRDGQIEKCDLLKKSVDLNTGIKNLIRQSTVFDNIVKELVDIDSKKELQKILIQIHKELELLKTNSLEYNNYITNNNSSITNKIIEEQTKKLLKY